MNDLQTASFLSATQLVLKRGSIPSLLSPGLEHIFRLGSSLVQTPLLGLIPSIPWLFKPFRTASGFALFEETYDFHSCYKEGNSHIFLETYTQKFWKIINTFNSKISHSEVPYLYDEGQYLLICMICWIALLSILLLQVLN